MNSVGKIIRIYDMNLQLWWLVTLALLELAYCQKQNKMLQKLHLEQKQPVMQKIHYNSSSFKPDTFLEHYVANVLNKSQKDRPTIFSREGNVITTHRQYQYGHRVIRDENSSNFLPLKRFKRNFKQNRITDPQTSPASMLESGENDYVEKFEIENASNNLFICNHPPLQFNPGFVGHSESECDDYDFIYDVKLYSTYHLCDYVYEKIHGRIYHPDRIWGLKLEKIEKEMEVIYDENFVRICLPLFKRFNSCVEKNHVTICEDEGVLFLHSHQCQLPSNDDLFFYVLLSQFAAMGKELCFQRVCDGFMRIIEKKANNITFHVLEIDVTYAGVNSSHNCSDAGDIMHSLKTNDTKCFINLYQPACYPYALVFWTGNSEDHVMSHFWEILPTFCKVKIIFLSVVVGLILLMSVVGNTMVILVMLKGRHLKQGSSMLRTSLAFADLITGLFIIAPSFSEHIMLIYGYWYTELKGDPSNEDDCANSVIIINQTTDPTHVHSEMFGHHHNQIRICQAMILSMCIIVSILTLFVLSLERYIITKKSFRYNEYFTPGRARCLILIIWSVAFIDGILYSINHEGKISVGYMPTVRLPHGQTDDRSWLMDIMITIRTVILEIISGFTVLISFLALRNFLKEKSNVEKEWHNLSMRVSGPFNQENKRIITSLFILGLLSLISVTPFFCYHLIRSRIFTPDFPIFKYVSWWLVLAPSAWNPWIYNARSYQFKDDLRRFLGMKK